MFSCVAFFKAICKRVLRFIQFRYKAFLSLLSVSGIFKMGQARIGSKATVVAFCGGITASAFDYLTYHVVSVLLMGKIHGQNSRHQGSNLRLSPKRERKHQTLEHSLGGHYANVFALADAAHVPKTRRQSFYIGCYDSNFRHFCR